MPRFNPDDYISVQDRINQFWADYPDGSIETAIAASTPDHKSVIVIASVRQDRTGPVVTTGIANEIAGSGGANNGFSVENAETSAIGRALANMGYATSAKDRMSREDAEKVNRLEAGQAEAPAPAARHVASRAAATAPAVDGEAITPGQSKNLYRLYKELERQGGFTKDMYKAELEALGFPTDDRRLTKDQASDAIRHFKELAGEPVDDDR